MGKIKWLVRGSSTRRLPYWANGFFYPSWNRLYRFTAYRYQCSRLPDTDLTLAFVPLCKFATTVALCKIVPGQSFSQFSHQFQVFFAFRTFFQLAGNRAATRRQRMLTSGANQNGLFAQQLAEHWPILFACGTLASEVVLEFQSFLSISLRFDLVKIPVVIGNFLAFPNGLRSSQNTSRSLVVPGISKPF